MVKVKERAEALTSEMSNDQQSAIRALGNELHRLNQAVVSCVISLVWWMPYNGNDNS